MQHPLSEVNAIKAYIRINWPQYQCLAFDKLKDITRDAIQWDLDKKIHNQIWFWFKDEKKRAKKKHAGTASVMDKSEQAQKIFVKEEGTVLQTLARLKTIDARFDFLKEQVHTNFMLILDLMQAIPVPPYETFLEELFILCSELEDAHSQVLLFIRICALYSDELIGVDQGLVKRTLVELSTQTEDSNAAYGLLKLAFNNEISFDQLPINILLAFEKQYMLEIQAFMRLLHGRIDFQVAQSVPDTCLIFTQPFFKILRNRGKLLHEGMQPCYLVHVVQLIAYSFETQYQLVEEFVEVFKTGCLSIYGRGVDLLPLLQRLIEEEIAQNKLYFSSLMSQIKLFEQLFYLLKENKIKKQVDSVLIEELIGMNEEYYMQRRKQRKDINCNEEDSLKNYLKIFSDENKLKNVVDRPAKEALEILQDIFKKIGISALNDIQTTSLALMEQKNKTFQVFGTGTGKTTLALAYILKMVKINKIKCFYVNTLSELRTRDFNLLINIAQEMNIKATLIIKDEELDQIDSSQIVFLSSVHFQQISRHNELKEQLKESMLILDEFDLTLFNQAVTQNELSSYTIAKYITAFTGSPLEASHVNLIWNYFNVLPLNFPNFQRINSAPNICKSQEVLSTRKLQLQRLLEICVEQAQRTPIILILEVEAIEVFKKMCQRARVPVNIFNEKSPNEITAFLDTTFTIQNDGYYHVCILNNIQG